MFQFYLFGSYLHNRQAAHDIDLVLETDDFERDWPLVRPLLEALSQRTAKPIDLFLSWNEDDNNECAFYDGAVPLPNDESTIDALWRFEQRFLGEGFFDNALPVDLATL